MPFASAPKETRHDVTSRRLLTNRYEGPPAAYHRKLVKLLTNFRSDRKNQRSYPERNSQDNTPMDRFE
jgi:hypothetical protein